MTSDEKRLLVVDDSEELLNIVSRSMAANGYEVLWARNGADALKLLTRDDRDISLMIVDVVLPGMSGPELVEQVLQRHPGARPVYVSAYDEEIVASHGVDPHSMTFLSKPFEPEALIRVVDEVIGGS